MQLARELVARGAQVVVVGGTARRLLGAPRAPRDLDVVVAERDVDRLVRALDSLGSPLRSASLRRVRDLRVLTAWGPLDVFVRDGVASVEVEGLRVVA